jgi:hypothetical protein
MTRSHAARWLVIIALVTGACSSSHSSVAAGRLRTPSELVTIGFRRSRVVMLNDVHNGGAQLGRARRVARSVLPAARQAGVTLFAMEALTTPFAEEANRSRAVPPPPPAGYLGHPDMRDLVAKALELGMTLVPYEAGNDPAEIPASLRGTPGADPAYVDWRERTQAAHLAAFLRRQPKDTKLLVFPGTGHLGKKAIPDFTPMAVYFQRTTRIEPFSIDQTVTSSLYHDRPWMNVSTPTKTALAAMENTSGGYLRTEDPNPARRARTDVDAFIVSLENTFE